MASIGFKNPDFPDDIIFDLGGIAVPNGGSVELDKDAELAFFAKYGQTVKDYFKDNSMVQVSGKSELTTADKDAYAAAEETATEVEETNTTEEDEA